MSSPGKPIWRKRLNETDVFHFECTCCGACCRGDIDIFLNPEDLQRMIAYLGFERSGELFDRGFIGKKRLPDGGYRPVMRFKQSIEKFCPFLENRVDDQFQLSGLCKLHPKYKPLICSLAPFGREIDEKGNQQWWFTEPISGCPGCTSNKTVRVDPILESNRGALHREHCYFQVLEKLQAKKAAEDIWDELHFSIDKHCAIQGYLEVWLERLQE